MWPMRNCLWNFCTHVLWSRISSFFVSIPWPRKKIINFFTQVIGSSHFSKDSHWIKMVDYSFQIFYIINDFCLLDLSVTERGKLNSPIMLMIWQFLLIFQFNFCVIYFEGSYVIKYIYIRNYCQYLPENPNFLLTCNKLFYF